MIALLARFSLVGIVNSAIGFAVIAIFDLGLHLPPALANALGYLVGVCVSFFLTRGFVFRSRDGIAGRAWRFALAMGFAFLLNQLVLWGAGRVLGAGTLPHLEAQLMGVAVYTITNFLLCRHWVFAAQGTQ
jgi:putative flippase GtrA